MKLLYLVSVICLIVILKEIKQHTKWHDLAVSNGVDTVDETLGELEIVGMVGYSIDYQIGGGMAGLLVAIAASNE